MKTIKIILSIITILFAILGLFDVLSFDVANPIMLTSLATLILLRGIEFKNARDRRSFILMLIIALFVYVVVIYNVFL